MQKFQEDFNLLKKCFSEGIECSKPHPTPAKLDNSALEGLITLLSSVLLVYLYSKIEKCWYKSK